MMKRLVFDCIFLIAIFYAPWWVTTPLLIFGIFYFITYYEAVVGGILLDLLYGINTRVLLGGYGMFGFLGGVALFLFFENIKKGLRYYDK